VLGPLTSPLVQRYVTTDSRVEDLNIIGVETRPRLVRFPGGTTLLPSEVFVHTRAAGEPLVAEVIGP
ncbi:MAG TPA: hypothetical protein PLF39_05930, partial [Synergistales bacterium]|nr:hypothetical protein [Synergistales bacterium]